MMGHRGTLAALAVCLLALTVVPLGGTTADAGANASGAASAVNGSQPGHAVSSTVVAHEARVGGSLEAAVLDADVAAAESARARVARLAAFERTLARVLALLDDDALSSGAGGVAASPAGEHVRDWREARALAVRDLAVHANRTAGGVAPNASERTQWAFADHARSSEDVVDDRDTRRRSDDTRDDALARDDLGDQNGTDKSFLLTGDHDDGNWSEGHEQWHAPDDWHRPHDGSNDSQGHCEWCRHDGSQTEQHDGARNWSDGDGAWGDHGDYWHGSSGDDWATHEDWGTKDGHWSASDGHWDSGTGDWNETGHWDSNASDGATHGSDWESTEGWSRDEWDGHHGTTEDDGSYGHDSWNDGHT